MAQTAFLMFVLLVFVYKIRFPVTLPLRHAVAISVFLLAIVTVAGIIGHNFWVAALGVSTALISGWTLLMAKYPRIRRMFYDASEWPDD